MQWKDTEYPGYMVSDTGLILSLKNTESKVLKGRPHSHGYVAICVRHDGKSKYRLLHRLVATAFIPNPDNKMEVNHKDGDKKNNNASNLEWATHSENGVHAYKTGLRVSALGNRKLSDKDVAEIKALLKAEKKKIIASMYGVGFTAIHNIARGTSWRNI